MAATAHTLPDRPTPTNRGHATIDGVARLTLKAEGPAEPDEAWERYALFARWPSWAPQISDIQASAQRIAPGVTGTLAGPMWASVDFTVDAVDEDARRWSWTVERRPVTIRMQHGVRAVDKGAATWLTIEGPLPLVVPYAPIARAGLRRLVAR